MKKNALTTALVAGLVGVAGIASVSNAVNLNPDGLGQALIYPYYTVNNGNVTLLSVVNTTGDGKALKVAFKDGLDSLDIFDFNLYMSPYDVWTASVALAPTGQGADGLPVIATADTSCTVPNLINPRPELAAVTLSPGVFGVPLRNGAAAVADRREGYFTIVEMGELVGDSLVAATHFGGATPVSCQQLVDAWAPGGTRNYWTVSPIVDIDVPTGGLFGNGSVINVGEGRMNSYAAEALADWSNVRQHTNPDRDDPQLAAARSAGVAAPGADSFVFDAVNNRLIQSRWGAGAQAVSAVLTANKIVNEYATTIGTPAGDAFDSEWVLTFPTKRFHATAACGGSNTAFIPPFQACAQPFFINLYNREEEVFNPQLGSPGLAPAMRREVQVLSFNDEGGAPSDILGAPSFLNAAAPGFTEGWAEIGFGLRPTGGVFGSSTSFTSTAVVTPAIPASTYFGLPVVGFWAFSANNTQGLPGVRAFYGDFFKHRSEKRITQ
jgi:hypothetical protein